MSYYLLESIKKLDPSIELELLEALNKQAKFVEDNYTIFKNHALGYTLGISEQLQVYMLNQLEKEKIKTLVVVPPLTSDLQYSLNQLLRNSCYIKPSTITQAEFKLMESLANEEVELKNTGYIGNPRDILKLMAIQYAIANPNQVAAAVERERYYKGNKLRKDLTREDFPSRQAYRNYLRQLNKGY